MSHHLCSFLTPRCDTMKIVHLGASLLVFLDLIPNLITIYLIAQFRKHL